MLPKLFTDSLFDDWMDDFSFSRNPQPKLVSREMRTDIKETDDSYMLDIELPGYKKEDLKLELNDGYLTVSANKNVENSNKDDSGRVIRRERFFGTVSRSYYVGKDVLAEEVKAKFEDGILNLTVPKKDQKQIKNNNVIMID